MVNKRTAQRLDKRRRFRKPLFQRDSVLYLWRLVEAAPTAGESVPNDKKIVAFPKEPSKAPRGRPSERDTVRQTLAQMRAEGASLREPHKRLAEIVAKKNGRTLGDRRWDERTIVQHISEWLRENPDTV